MLLWPTTLGCLVDKQFVDNATVAVTFDVPAAIGATAAAISGDFTGWTPLDMDPHPDGSFTITVDLDTNSRYEFRYVLGYDDRADHQWENDWAADEYVPNMYGTENSVVTTEPPTAP